MFLGAAGVLLLLHDGGSMAGRKGEKAEHGWSCGRASNTVAMSDPTLNTRGGVVVGHIIINEGSFFLEEFPMDGVSQ